MKYKGIIQRDSSISEIDIQQDKEQQSLKERSNKCIRLMKLLSLGQYRTPLYYQSSDSYSSIFGGVTTILGIILIMIFSYETMIPIFRSEHSNLDHQTKQLQHLTKDPDSEQGSLIMTDCTVNHCLTLTNEEFLRYLFEKDGTGLDILIGFDNLKNPA